MSKDKTVEINRAPVLTLWAAVVAERLGFDREEALTLGKGLAGLNAQSKGRKLGIFKPSEDKEPPRKEAFAVELLGRQVPARQTDEGVRALNKDSPVQPDSVTDYLRKKFGDDLDDARDALEGLANAYEPDELNEKGYDLYTSFRPEIPSGKKGWGAKGPLDLKRIREMAEEA